MQGWREFWKKLEEDKRENYKLLYRVVKAKRQGKQPIFNQNRDAHGNMLNNPEDITQRWKEYFETLFNEEAITNKQAETEDPTENYTEEGIINIEEIEDAIKELKNGKAAGYDMIKSEQIKYASKKGVELIHKLINMVWKHKETPKDWKTAVILPIYKKGPREECSNYRGISLLSTMEKIYEKVLERRLTTGPYIYLQPNHKEIDRV